MVKVVDSNVHSQEISKHYSAVRYMLFGATLGLIYWLINLIIGNYVNSITISEGISTILVATVGLAVLIRLRAPRPIIVVASAALTLWGLASWTSGLSRFEIIAWDVLFYSLAYLLFTWLSRYSKVVPVIITVVAIVILARLAISL